MSEEKNVTQELIKQSSGVLEKAYDDLAHPTAKSLGNTVSLLPRTIGVWLGKWEKWIINGEESIRLTAQAVQEKAAKIPEEKLTEPEPYVAVPAIQQLSYCYDSEELREMYANLLVSSMNSDTKWQVHPSFLDIIKQLSPLDAKAIDALMQAGQPLPIVTVTLNFTESKSLLELLLDYSIDLFSLYGDTDIMCSSLQNLDRLGILNIRYDQVVKPDNRYVKFEEDPVYIGLVKEYGGKDKTKIELKKGLIELSEFGKMFCKCCCEE